MCTSVNKTKIQNNNFLENDKCQFNQSLHNTIAEVRSFKYGHCLDKYSSKF